jgi:hypothetical protein
MPVHSGSGHLLAPDVSMSRDQLIGNAFKCPGTTNKKTHCIELIGTSGAVHSGPTMTYGPERPKLLP